MLKFRPARIGRDSSDSVRVDGSLSFKLMDKGESGKVYVRIK